MSLSFKLFLSLFLLNFFVFPEPCHSTIETQLFTRATINRVCEQTINYGFCATTLEQYPRTSLADMKDLATITIMFAVAQARLNKYAVNELEQREDNEPVKGKLTDCFNDYTVVLHKLQDAYKICKDKDYKAMMGLVNDATDLTIKCQNRFVRHHPIHPYPIADYSQRMLWLNNIALVVLTMLA